jgi:outer membrane receptor protein involved in Fe transport
LIAASVAAGADTSVDDGTPGPSPIGIGAGDVPSLIESSTMFFAQNANIVAGFANVDWHFLPRWTLVSGLRLSYENKKAVWKRVFTTPTHVAFTQSLNWREFQGRDERSDFDFVPKVALGWKPYDFVSVFASWTKGVKGGGFNDTASGPSKAERTFDRERVEQWEIDSRWTLLDGTLAAGLTLFRMELRDFQLITTRPQDLQQIVENVGRLRAQGVEAEALYLPTEWLTILATIGYNDAHFIEFPFGACALSMTDTDGDGDARCDYKGVPFAPNWTISFTPTVSYSFDEIPLLKNVPHTLGHLALEWALTTQFADVYRNPVLQIDFRNREPSFFALAGHLGVTSPDGGWSIAVHGENLTDRLVNVATLEISGLPDNFLGTPEPGRVLFLQARYQF